jgi:hypothetical protein
MPVARRSSTEVVCAQSAAQDVWKYSTTSVEGGKVDKWALKARGLVRWRCCRVLEGLSAAALLVPVLILGGDVGGEVISTRTSLWLWLWLWLLLVEMERDLKLRRWCSGDA